MTFAGALESATAVTEHSWSYQDILGVTGLAFRVRWYTALAVDQWGPLRPVLGGREKLALASAATGWRLELQAVPDGAEGEGGTLSACARPSGREDVFKTLPKQRLIVPKPSDALLR